jgi:hypothetical protein
MALSAAVILSRKQFKVTDIQTLEKDRRPERAAISISWSLPCFVASIFRRFAAIAAVSQEELKARKYISSGSNRFAADVGEIPRRTRSAANELQRLCRKLRLA